MKLKPQLSRPSESGETEMDARVQEAVTDAITESNDKTIEIRPANESGGRGPLALLALVGVVVAVGYWLRTSRQSSDTLQSVADETADRTKQVTEEAANRTEQMTEEAADTIQQGGETVAEQVEEGSQKAGEQVQQTGEKAAEEAEKAGETATEKVDESGSSGSDSSASS